MQMEHFPRNILFKHLLFITRSNFNTLAYNSQFGTYSARQNDTFKQFFSSSKWAVSHINSILSDYLEWMMVPRDDLREYQASS